MRKNGLSFIANKKIILKQFYETVTLSGEDSEQSKSLKWRLLREGNFQALITTGQYFEEGTDLTNFSSVFLVYPFSFEGKLIQYIGRVRRSETAPTTKTIGTPRFNTWKCCSKGNVYYKKLYGTIDGQHTHWRIIGSDQGISHHASIAKNVRLFTTKLNVISDTQS